MNGPDILLHVYSSSIEYLTLGESVDCSLYGDGVSDSNPMIDCYCCSSFVVHFDPGSANKARVKLITEGSRTSFFGIYDLCSTAVSQKSIFPCLAGVT
jgi:hypothetical protein